MLTMQEKNFPNSMLQIQTLVRGSGEDDVVRETGEATPVLLERSPLNSNILNQYAKSGRLVLIPMVCNSA